MPTAEGQNTVGAGTVYWGRTGRKVLQQMNIPADFETSEGFVVTPSRMPSAAASFISSMFAVSIKNFMVFSPFLYYQINKTTQIPVLSHALFLRKRTQKYQVK